MQKPFTETSELLFLSGNVLLKITYAMNTIKPKLSIILLLICFVIISCSHKASEKTTHVEEFFLFKVDIPNIFKYRTDEVDDNLIQKTIWNEKKSGGDMLTLQMILPNLLRSDVNVQKSLIANEADNLLFNYPSEFEMKEIVQTDSTLMCKMYYKGQYINKYYYGVMHINKVYIAYTYIGTYSEKKLLEILNSITLWDKDFMEYETYDNPQLSFSIDYPKGWIINDTIQNNGVCFSDKESSLVYSVTKSNEYNGCFIDSIVVHKSYAINDSIVHIHMLQREEQTDVDIDGHETFFYIENNLPISKYMQWYRYHHIYFVKGNDGYYIVSFGNEQKPLLYQHSNKIKDIANSLKLY